MALNIKEIKDLAYLLICFFRHKLWFKIENFDIEKGVILILKIWLI